MIMLKFMVDWNDKNVDNYLCISASHMTSVRSRFTADCLIFIISNDLWCPGLVLTSRRPLYEWSFGFQRAIIRWCRSNRERCKEVESYSKVSNKNHPHFFHDFFSLIWSLAYFIVCDLPDQAIVYGIEIVAKQVGGIKESTEVKTLEL